MARRFHGGGRIGRAPQRQIANATIFGASDGIVPVAGTVKALGDVGLATTGGPGTIVRTRGSVLARMATVSGTATIMSVTWGIILVSTDAATAGVASVPGPETDDGNDWYAWGVMQLAFGGTAGENFIGQIDRQNFDSRGMRKSKVGDISVMVIEVNSDVAGGTLDFGYSFREQFKT